MTVIPVARRVERRLLFASAVVTLMLAGVVVLVVIIDTFRDKRLHPAFGWGIALLLTLNYATYIAQISI